MKLNCKIKYPCLTLVDVPQVLVSLEVILMKIQHTLCAVFSLVSLTILIQFIIIYYVMYYDMNNNGFMP